MIHFHCSSLKTESDKRQLFTVVLKSSIHQNIKLNYSEAITLENTYVTWEYIIINYVVINKPFVQCSIAL